MKYLPDMRGLDLIMAESGKKSTGQDVTCILCILPYRVPYSANCRHPACKSCWVVYLTRDLPDLEDIKCPTCDAKIKHTELKPDQTAQRRLQKYKNTRCKNCSWRGSYTDYIVIHERVCGNIVRIQCNVLGCEKWLPKDKALELHRHDDWCPMILLMRTRLSHAEIVHLSMRESWEWTCGLVMRSDKSAVSKLIERLVSVFSVLDPDMRVALDNDEYGEAAQYFSENEDERNVCENYSGSMPSTIESNHCHSDADDNKREETSQSGANAIVMANEASTNLPLDDSLIQLNLSGQRRLLNPRDNGFSEAPIVDELSKRIAKIDSRIEIVRKDQENSRKIIEDLKNTTRAVAVLNEKQNVMEGVMATFNNEVLAMNTRMDNFKIPNMLADTGILEKLVKANQDINRSITSLAQSLQNVDTRLLEVEASHTGIFLWKIANYSQKKQEAKTTNIKSVYSPPFFTSQYGYKLCGRVFLMGDGVGRGTHISLFLTIMKGPHDAVLPWPFQEKITFQLVNQDDPTNKSVVEAFRPDPTSSSFKRPTSERNIGAGCPLFAKIQLVDDPKKGFIRDDNLYLKIISRTSDLPEIK